MDITYVVWRRGILLPLPLTQLPIHGVHFSCCQRGAPVMSHSQTISSPSDGLTSADPSNTKADGDSEARTLVLCVDGTSDHSNVWKFHGLLVPDNDTQKSVHQRGPGTRDDTPIALVINIQERAIGSHLKAYVVSAYKFVVDNYKGISDSICFLGYSRGAMIVRIVAGMIHKVGLLPKGGSEAKIGGRTIFTWRRLMETTKRAGPSPLMTSRSR
ncbi:hypothetical protein LXA43DRAFT_456466 [Ganoderma leucocontextum]|nr:hypothetical protein LXA43DRAFT_456466 [Ganoderma leucocontextum]